MQASIHLTARLSFGMLLVILLLIAITPTTVARPISLFRRPDLTQCKYAERCFYGLGRIVHKQDSSSSCREFCSFSQASRKDVICGACDDLTFTLEDFGIFYSLAMDSRDLTAQELQQLTRLTDEHFQSEINSAIESSGHFLEVKSVLSTTRMVQQGDPYGDIPSSFERYNLLIHYESMQVIVDGHRNETPTLEQITDYVTNAITVEYILDVVRGKNAGTPLETCTEVFLTFEHFGGGTFSPTSSPAPTPDVDVSYSSWFVTAPAAISLKVSAPGAEEPRPDDYERFLGLVMLYLEDNLDPYLPAALKGTSQGVSAYRSELVALYGDVAAEAGIDSAYNIYFELSEPRIYFDPPDTNRGALAPDDIVNIFQQVLSDPSDFINDYLQPELSDTPFALTENVVLTEAVPLFIPPGTEREFGFLVSYVIRNIEDPPSAAHVNTLHELTNSFFNEKLISRYADSSSIDFSSNISATYFGAEANGPTASVNFQVEFEAIVSFTEGDPIPGPLGIVNVMGDYRKESMYNLGDYIRTIRQIPSFASVSKVFLDPIK